MKVVSLFEKKWLLTINETKLNMIDVIHIVWKYNMLMSYDVFSSILDSQERVIDLGIPSGIYCHRLFLDCLYSVGDT